MIVSLFFLAGETILRVRGLSVPLRLIDKSFAAVLRNLFMILKKSSF